MNNVVLSTRNIDDFISDVANEVVKKIDSWNVSFPQKEPEPETPIGIKDVAVLTGYTLPTIYGYCQRNEIPFHKKSNRNFFFKSEIIDWIKTGRQKTLKELSIEADSYLSSK